MSLCLRKLRALNVPERVVEALVTEKPLNVEHVLRLVVEHRGLPVPERIERNTIQP